MLCPLLYTARVNIMDTPKHIGHCKFISVIQNNVCAILTSSKHSPCVFDLFKLDEKSFELCVLFE